MEKEDVYVPEYPGKKVFEKYHGIPAEEYLQKTKEAIEQFIRNTNYTYTIKTSGKTQRTQRNIKKVFVTVTDDTIKIEADGNKYSIQPTKWGTDIVFLFILFQSILRDSS